MSPSLDTLLGLDVAGLFADEMLRQGRSLLRDGRVAETQVNEEEDTIWAVIYDGKRRFLPRFTVQGKQALLGCDCDQISHDNACPHVVALLLAWIEDLDTFQRGISPFDPQARGGYPPEPEEPPLEAAAPSVEEIVRDYRGLLQGLTVPEMRELAVRREVRLSGLRREGILEMLAAGLAQPDNLLRAIERLSSASRLALDLLLLMTYNLSAFTISHFEKRIDEFLAEKQPGRKTSGCLEELRQAALVFNSRGSWQFPLAVKGLRRPGSDLVDAFKGRLGRVDAPEPLSFARLALWLALLSQAGQVECSPPVKSQQGGWPASDAFPKSMDSARLPPFPSYLTPESLRRVAAATGQPSEKVDFVAALLDRARFWAHEEPRKLGPAFTGWLQKRPDEQSRFLLRKALSLESPSELEQARQAGNFQIVRAPHSGAGYRQFLGRLAAGRDLLSRVLALLPPGEWLDINSLLGLMFILLPDPLAAKGPYNTVWFEKSGARINPAQFDLWRQSYGLFYVMSLAGPFHWMGACEISYQGGEVVAFRLTEFGAYLLGSRDQVELPGQATGKPSLTFTQNGWLELDPSLASAETISLVMLVGHPETGKATRPDRNAGQPRQLLTYAILVEGLGRAFEAGWTGPKIQAALERAAGSAMPASLASQIKAIWERYGRLHFYPDMALIRFADDFCLPELLTGTHLGQYLLYTFSPRLIAVRPENVESLLSELREKGYTPRVEGKPHG